MLQDVGPAVGMVAFLCFVSPLSFSDDGPDRASMDAFAYALCIVAGAGLAVRRRFPLAGPRPASTRSRSSWHPCAPRG